MPKAKSDLMLGFAGLIRAGEEVPRTYFDTVGEHNTDFDDLAARGLVDKAAVTRAEKAVKVEAAVAHVAEAKAEVKAAEATVAAAKPADKPAAKK